jgi:aminoglycoside 2''-phosphotransferase
MRPNGALNGAVMLSATERPKRKAHGMNDANTVADCLRLLDVAFPSLHVQRSIVLGEGWDSLALLVNDHLVFRFAKRPDAAVRQAREADLLPWLSDRLPLPVPRYTYTWTDPLWPGKRIVGYRLMAGESLVRAQRAQQASQAAQLGEFVSALHAAPLEEARRHGVVGRDAASLREASRAFFATVRAQMLPLFTAQEQAAMVAFWSGYLEDDACFAFTPTLVHRDLVAEHVLVDPLTGQLTGVIDWGDAGIDDPAVDFAGMRRQLGAEFAQQMLAAYHPALDASALRRMERRMDIYAGMEPFHEIHFAQTHGDAAHLTHGVEWARRQFAHG